MDALLVVMVISSFILMLFVNVGAVATQDPTLVRFIAIYWKIISIPLASFFVLLLLASYGIVSAVKIKERIVVVEPIGLILGTGMGLAIIMFSFLLVGVLSVVPRLEVAPTVMVALLIVGAIVETALFWIILPEALETLFFFMTGYKYLSILLSSILAGIVFGLLHAWAYGVDVTLVGAILSCVFTATAYLLLRDYFPSIGSGFVIAHIVWNLLVTYGLG